MEMKLVLTTDDWHRIMSCVGAMSVIMLQEAEDEKDINESVRLHELHGKLIAIGIDALSEINTHDVC